MEDVSDPPFRAVCKEGGADLMYTEFISSEGPDPRCCQEHLERTTFFEYERPMGIQLFGGNVDSMREEFAEIATRANPEIIDINYEVAR